MFSMTESSALSNVPAEGRWERFATLTGRLVLMAGLWSIVSLLLRRRRFPSRLSPGSIRRAVLVVAGGLAISAATAVALTMAVGGRLHTVDRKIVWARRAAFGVEPCSADPGWQSQHGAHWVATLV